MEKAYRSSELYVVAYVLAVLGARTLGLDFHGLDPETVRHANHAVQQVADAWRQTQAAGGDSSMLMAVLGGLWVAARTSLKMMEGRR